MVSDRDEQDLLWLLTTLLAAAGLSLLVWMVVTTVTTRPWDPSVHDPIAVDTSLMLSPESADVIAGHRIRINHAGASTLDLLPGVGPTLAKNIIAHREARGPIRSARELEAVNRIGPVVREQMTPWIRFD